MSTAKYKLRILKPAQQELEIIYNVYYELSGEKAATKIIDTIYDKLSNLENNPLLGLSCKKKFNSLDEFRMLIMGTYLCFYKVFDNKIYVYHIVNGKTDYPELLNDFK